MKMCDVGTKLQFVPLPTFSHVDEIVMRGKFVAVVCMRGEDKLWMVGKYRKGISESRNSIENLYCGFELEQIGGNMGNIQWFSPTHFAKEGWDVQYTTFYMQADAEKFAMVEAL